MPTKKPTKRPKREDAAQSAFRALQHVIDTTEGPSKPTKKPTVVRAVEPRVSHECNLIQIADVLMGAIAYHSNGCHKAANASPHRCALAAHIAKRAKLVNLAQGTRYGRRDFEIWRFRFSKPKGQA